MRTKIEEGLYDRARASSAEPAAIGNKGEDGGGRDEPGVGGKFFNLSTPSLFWPKGLPSMRAGVEMGAPARGQLIVESSFREVVADRKEKTTAKKVIIVTVTT